MQAHDRTRLVGPAGCRTSRSARVQPASISGSRRSAAWGRRGSAIERLAAGGQEAGEQGGEGRPVALLVEQVGAHHEVVGGRGGQGRRRVGPVDQHGRHPRARLAAALAWTKASASRYQSVASARAPPSAATIEGRPTPQPSSTTRRPAGRGRRARRRARGRSARAPPSRAAARRGRSRPRRSGPPRGAGGPSTRARAPTPDLLPDHVEARKGRRALPKTTPVPGGIPPTTPFNRRSRPVMLALPMALTPMPERRTLPQASEDPLAVSLAAALERQRDQRRGAGEPAARGGDRHQPDPAAPALHRHRSAPHGGAARAAGERPRGQPGLLRRVPALAGAGAARSRHRGLRPGDGELRPPARPARPARRHRPGPRRVLALSSAIHTAFEGDRMSETEGTVEATETEAAETEAEAAPSTPRPPTRSAPTRSRSPTPVPPFPTRSPRR